MSDVPLAGTKLKVAKPLPVRAEPILPRAKPLASADAAVPAPVGSLALPVGIDADLASIRLDVFHRYRERAIKSQGVIAALVCMSHMVVQEAPAWALSMFIHMVTLVTMAMITVPEPVPYKAQHLVVAPPEEQKIEEIKEIAEETDKPVEKPSPPPPEKGANVDKSVVLENPTFAGENVPPIDLNDPQASPSTNETSPTGIETMTKSDVLATPSAVTDSLQGRKNAEDPKKVEEEGGNKASQESVASALKWLANHQLPDGGWSFNHLLCPTCRDKCRDAGKMAEARNAATGLALLPFLGSGQTHKESARYKSTINNGLNFLVNHMRISSQGGALNESGGNMYSHGIATIALCEAYAMTKDMKLLTPARAALNFTCYAQDPKGGGWRYNPRQAGDTSVVGWQLMALKSGYMADLLVPKGVSRKASLFLDHVQSDGGTLYGYTDAGKGSDATVAVGLLSRMYLGWKKDNTALQRGVQWLANRGPSAGNMYYNYYATQVMRHWEGEEWKTWNRQMRDQLIHAQARQGHELGSWFTGAGDNGAVPGGRLYCTAMATMILEVYYRHMPIYRLQSMEQDFPD